MKIQKCITLRYETIKEVSNFIKDKDINFSNFIEETILNRIRSEVHDVEIPKNHI